MFKKIGKSAELSKNRIIDKLAVATREKAISRAKTRILLHGRKVEEYSQEDLETIVKEEEDKIVAGYRKMGLVGLLALVGIGVF